MLHQGDHTACHEAGSPHRHPTAGDLAHFHQAAPVHYVDASPGTGRHHVVGLRGAAADVYYDLHPIALHAGLRVAPGQDPSMPLYPVIEPFSQGMLDIDRAPGRGYRPVRRPELGLAGTAISPVRYRSTAGPMARARSSTLAPVTAGNLSTSLVTASPTI